MYQAEE